MPQINLIPAVYYEPQMPFHWEYDNLPLRNIIARQELINSATDINYDILRDAAGTQGSLDNRLNQSLEQDGSLKVEAVDDILHNIGNHTDGEYLGVEYVRMLASERDKLALIADEATNLAIQIETPSTVVLFDDGIVNFEASTTISWEVVSPSTVKANLAFDSSTAHQHFYDLEPVHENIVTPDYENYKVTSVATPYIEDSLRVYINGVRLSSSEEIYVPGDLVTDSWTLIQFTPDHTSGTFSLSTAITSDDVIRIDFDRSLV